MRTAYLTFISVTGLTVLIGGLLLINPFYSEVEAFKKRKPEKVRVVNGPEMPVSVNVQNKPTVRARQRGEWTVNVRNDPNVKVINGPDMPVSVSARKESFFTRCFATIDEGQFQKFCEFSPEPPTDKLFLIKYLNAFVTDNQGADVQYRFALHTSQGGTILNFLPSPTVLADDSNKGLAVVTENILTGHAVPGATNLRLQATRNIGGEVGLFVGHVTGFLVDAS